MSIPQREMQHGTFFVTSRTADCRRLFQVAANAELFLAVLQHYRREGAYKLHAFVVMPDHFHVLLTTNGITLERAVQLIKGGFSRRFESKQSVWQRGFTDHRIRNRADHLHHMEYIAHNPVRARLCQRPEEFAYSSSFRQADLSG